MVRRVARRFAAPKVHVARRIARRANPRITFEGIVGDVADDHVARRITDCDFIFLAADTMLASERRQPDRPPVPDPDVAGGVEACH